MMIFSRGMRKPQDAADCRRRQAGLLSVFGSQHIARARFGSGIGGVPVAPLARQDQVEAA